MMKPKNFDKRLQHSIELLQKAQSLALSFSEKGYYLAFSGGKDSQCLYHVACLAGVKFEAHYQLTTIDPPEVVRFIKFNYPDVKVDLPEMTFSHLCLKKKALPTRIMRFCCSELKETKGAGTVTLTGVRKQESVNRAKRNEAEIISRTESRRFSNTYEQFDQFTRQKEMENVQCIRGKDKIVINPIIYWSEHDVWYFLNEVVAVNHCSLYDDGVKRIGCLFCPMSSQKEILRECNRYPKYKDMIIRTIHRLRENGYLSDYTDLTDDEVFKWWTSKQSLDYWYVQKKDQLSLF